MDLNKEQLYWDGNEDAEYGRKPALPDDKDYMQGYNDRLKDIAEARKRRGRK